MSSLKTKKKNFIEKPRGFYSECITSPQLCKDYFVDTDDTHLEKAPIDEMLAWKMKAFRSLPYCNGLMPPSVPKSILQSTQRWIQFDTSLKIDFPLHTIEPKVQLEKNVPFGHLPRDVEIERRRQRNALICIEDELGKAGIKMVQLIPVHKMREYLTVEEKANIFRKSSSHLPLEWFDNYDFDCRTPEEWLCIGDVDSVRHSIPAKAFLPNPGSQWTTRKESKVTSTPGSHRTTSSHQHSTSLNSKKTSILLADIRSTLYRWVTVAVTNYDCLKDRWYVTDLENKINYLIPRIYVVFYAEDTLKFCDRIKQALELRAKCEAYMKFLFIIDNMVLTGLPELPDEVLARILKFTLCSRQMQAMNREWIDQLLTENTHFYQKVLCVIEMRKTIAAYPEQYSDIDWPEAVEFNKPFDIIDTGMEDFDKIRRYYKQHTIYCMRKTINAMEGVATECGKVCRMSLFTNSLEKTSLDEFKRIQTKATTAMMKYLKVTWLELTTRAILLNVYNIGKGWFDVHVTTWELYLMSKLRRFVECVQFRMQEALRDMVNTSISMYCALLCAPCASFLSLPNDFKWGKDVKTSPFETLQPPVFTLELQMNEQGAFYSTNPTEFEPVILQLFIDALRQTHFVHIIDPLLLSSLVYPNNLYLTSIGLKDEIIDVKTELLQLSYQKALVALLAYAVQFKEHTNLFIMNANDFIGSIRDENRTSQQIKEEITFQLRMRENLQLTLPASIAIGPFFINVDPLKQFLINKRRDIADKLLKMLAERLQGKTKSICEQYRQINNRLSEKPRAIEHIYQVRAWIETIPEAIRALEEMMRTTLFEYEILEHFWYVVSNEQFYSKWEAIAWPHKINNQIHDTKEEHERDCEKFQKQQYSDVSTLSERVEELNVQIAGFTTQYDVGRVNELAVEIRKLWKMLQELQSYVELLNTRQMLFELPEIELIGVVKTMIENFKPYRDLWTTGSDIVKAKELWCGNPLATINVQTILKTVDEFKTRLTDLLLIFEEMPLLREITSTFLKSVEDFEPIVEIMNDVKNPDWTYLHWKELAKTAEMPIKYSENINFQYLLEHGVEKHAELVKEISILATEKKTELEVKQRAADETERAQEEERLKKKQRRLARTDI